MTYVLAFSLPVALVFLLKILWDWRFGAYLGFLWLLFGDTIRKLVPGQPADLILVGDFIFFVSYISFFVWVLIRQKRIWTPPFALSLLFFVAFVIIDFFNPFLPSLPIGLIGLRSYIWFLPLMFLGYYFFKEKNQAERVLKVFVYLAVPFFILAAAQLFLNSDLPVFKNFETSWQEHSFGIGGFGALEKIPSFFGSDQRYGMISILWFFLGLGLYSKGDKLLLVSIFSALGGVIISGSRSAFALTILGILVFFFAMRRARNGIDLRQRLREFSVKKFLIFMIVILISLVALYFLHIAAGPSNLLAIVNVFNSRAPHFFSRDLPAALENLTFFGHGTGTLSQGLQEVGGFKGVLRGVAYSGGETGFKRIIFELGVVGLFVFYIFWSRVLLSMRNIWRKTQDFKMQKLAVCIFIFVLLILVRFTFVHHQVLGDSMVLAAIWFFVGVFFKLTEKREVIKESAFN